MACGQQRVKGGHGSITASSSASCSASCSASIITLNLGVGGAPVCWPIFDFRNLLGARGGRRGQFSVQSDNRFSGRGGGVGSLPRAWRRVGVPRALWVVKDKQVGVLGLAFKPNTDDVRFAPAIEVISRLVAEGAQVRACDPEAMEKAGALLPPITYHRDPYEVAKNADALLITTEWEEFRRLDWERIRDLMARPLLLDARNLLDPAQMKALGFDYHSFGRPGC